MSDREEKDATKLSNLLPLIQLDDCTTMDGMDVDPPAPGQQQRGSGPRSTSPLAFGSSSSVAHPSSDPAGPQPQLQQLSQLRSSGANPREY
jgi:hypothetical protein